MDNSFLDALPTDQLRGVVRDVVRGLRAEIDRMRPIVDAAVKDREAPTAATRVALWHAVDAMTKGA